MRNSKNKLIAGLVVAVLVVLVIIALVLASDSKIDQSGAYILNGNGSGVQVYGIEMLINEDQGILIRDGIVSVANADIESTYEIALYFQDTNATTQVLLTSSTGVYGMGISLDEVIYENELILSEGSFFLSLKIDDLEVQKIFLGVTNIDLSFLDV